jgi:hypothetical protein
MGQSLAAFQKRREEGLPTDHEETVRQQILDGLIADKGGDHQISTATRILAEVVASDAAALLVFNNATRLRRGSFANADSNRLLNLFLSCPWLGFQSYLYPCTREHVNQLIDAETTDLSLQQVTDPWLCLAKEISRLGLRPPARSNVFPQINH